MLEVVLAVCGNAELCGCRVWQHAGLFVQQAKAVAIVCLPVHIEAQFFHLLVACPDGLCRISFISWFKQRVKSDKTCAILGHSSAGASFSLSLLLTVWPSPSRAS